MSLSWHVMICTFAALSVLQCIALATPTKPQIVCPEYFQYVCYGEHCTGKVTLRDISLRTIDLEVQLVQMHLVTRGNYGAISLIQDESNIKTGQLIAYTVHFPTANVLPRVTRIKVNENVVCQSDDYLFLPPFSQTMFLKHHLELDLPKQPTTSHQLVTTYYRNNDNQQQYNALSNTLMDATRLHASAPTDTTTTRVIQKTQPAKLVSVPEAEMPKKITSRSSFLPDDNAQPPDAQPQLPNISTNKQSELAQQQCGYQRANLNALNGGYASAERGALPWLAAVYKRDGANILYGCGGSLISLRTVLTAAHCLQQESVLPKTAVIFLGCNSLGNFNEVGIQTHTVADIIMHPEYLKNGMPDADIALMQLNHRAIANDYIRPICLWSDDMVANTAARPNDSELNGQKAVIAGWSVAGTEQPNNVPRIVEATFVSNAKCQSSANANSANTSQGRTLCAEVQQQSRIMQTNTCEQNGGTSLLMDHNDEHWQLRGIMTNTVNTNTNAQHSDNDGTCQAHRAYVIYCDLAKHQLWLLNLMQF